LAFRPSGALTVGDVDRHRFSSSKRRNSNGVRYAKTDARVKMGKIEAMVLDFDNSWPDVADFH